MSYCFLWAARKRTFPELHWGNRMKKIILAAALISCAAPIAHADIGAFAGLTYAFGANTGIGFTLHATSTRDENSAIASAGISYYPFAVTPMFGIPVGVGYQGKNAAAIVSYDLLLKKFAIAGGYASTRDDDDSDGDGASTSTSGSTSGGSQSGTGGGTGTGTGAGTGGGSGGGGGGGSGGGGGGGSEGGGGGGSTGGGGGAVAIIQ